MYNIFSWIFHRVMEELQQHDQDYEKMKKCNEQFSSEIRERMDARGKEFARRKVKYDNLFRDIRK
jgi:hypothetical protein